MNSEWRQPSFRARWRVAAGGSVLGLFALSGCGSLGSGGDSLDLAFATYEPSGSGGDAAQLRGVLADRDGCLVVRGEDGEESLPIWPRDQISLRATQPRIEIFGDGHELGESIEVAGGYTDPYEGPEVPRDCRAPAIPWFVVSGD